MTIQLTDRCKPFLDTRQKEPFATTITIVADAGVSAVCALDARRRERQRLADDAPRSRLTPSGACLCPVAAGLLNQTEDSKVEIGHLRKACALATTALLRVVDVPWGALVFACRYRFEVSE